jgi:hypothetical protein
MAVNDTRSLLTAVSNRHGNIGSGRVALSRRPSRPEISIENSQNAPTATSPFRFHVNIAERAMQFLLRLQGGILIASLASD